MIWLGQDLALPRKALAQVFTYADSSCPWSQGEGTREPCILLSISNKSWWANPRAHAASLVGDLGQVFFFFLGPPKSLPRYGVCPWSFFCLPSSPVAWSREGKNLRRSREPLTGPLLVPPQCRPVRVSPPHPAPRNSSLAPLGPEVVLHSLGCWSEPQHCHCLPVQP